MRMRFAESRTGVTTPQVSCCQKPKIDNDAEQLQANGKSHIKVLVIL